MTGERRRFPHFEARHREGRGWYVVSDTGYLAHVPGGDGQMRAAFFDTEEEAEACARDLRGSLN